MNGYTFVGLETVWWEGQHCRNYFYFPSVKGSTLIGIHLLPMGVVKIIFAFPSERGSTLQGMKLLLFRVVKIMFAFLL